MEQIKSVRVGVNLDIFMQNGTFLEVQDVQEFFELEISPQEDWRVYSGKSGKQAHELDDYSTYVIAHLPGGSNPENRVLEHHSYENLSKEEVMTFVESNLEDYMGSYLLIFEQEDYISPVDYLANHSTELVTFGWVLIPNADPYDPYWPEIQNTECLFKVPTLWLAEHLSDYPSAEEFVQDGEISEEWFDTYTHQDGYILYKAAKEAGMLLNTRIKSQNIVRYPIRTF